jgi:hypothetical protein
MPKKKPENSEELLQDIESHPDRGMLDGEDVVRFEPVNISCTLPRELENQLLEIGACLGMSKSDVLRHAIATFVAMPGNQAMISRWQQKKAERFVTNLLTIREKVFGSYKKIARIFQSRLNNDND